MSELVGLGKAAKAADVSQIWVTDNLQSRNSFVVLAALAANVPINLGTAVMVQYFRNPVDVADAAAAVSEMMDAQELSIGIARGNAGTPRFVNTVKPISMLRETAQSLARLLAGDAVQFNDYPTIASYFNFAPDASFQLNFGPKTPCAPLLRRERATEPCCGRGVHGRPDIRWYVSGRRPHRAHGIAA